MNKVIFSLLFLFSTYALNAQESRTGILQDLERDQAAAPPAGQEVKITATLSAATRLFGDKNDLTTVIMVIPNSSVVEVLDSDSTYLKVLFEDYEGYIFRRHAVINEVAAQTVPATETVEELSTAKETGSLQPQQPVEEQKISRFTYLENKYGSNMAAKLMAGKIWKGMNAEMIKDSWGTPRKINRVISGNLVKEEWIFRNTWLYIENDVLKDWGPIKN